MEKHIFTNYNGDLIFSLQKQLHLTSRRTLDGPRTSIFATPPTSALSISTTTITTTTTTLDSTTRTGSSVDLSTSLLLDGSFTYKPLVLLPSVGFGAALGLHQSPKLKTKWGVLPFNLFIFLNKFILLIHFRPDSYLSRTLPDEEKSVKSLDMSVIYESIQRVKLRKIL